MSFGTFSIFFRKNKNNYIKKIHLLVQEEISIRGKYENLKLQTKNKIKNLHPSKIWKLKILTSCVILKKIYTRKT